MFELRYAFMHTSDNREQGGVHVDAIGAKTTAVRDGRYTYTQHTSHTHSAAHTQTHMHTHTHQHGVGSPMVGHRLSEVLC